MKNKIFAEKYAPVVLDDLILSSNIRSALNQMLKENSLQNLLLVSKNPGLGKSSLAKVLINEFNANVKWINASLESGIDVLRTTIYNFVTAASLENKKKFVVLDEADYLNSSTTQPAFRGLLDEFSAHATFIFTANYENKLIEPLRNRLYIIDFDKMFIENKAEIIPQIVNKVEYILKFENISYEPANVAAFIKDYYPSIRKIIIDLQKMTNNGNFIYTQKFSSFTLYENVVKAILLKDPRALFKLIKNLNNPSGFYEYMYDNFLKYTSDKKITEKDYIIIGNYYYRDHIVNDKHLNLLTCCLDLMKGK